VINESATKLLPSEVSAGLQRLLRKKDNGDCFFFPKDCLYSVVHGHFSFTLPTNGNDVSKKMNDV